MTEAKIHRRGNAHAKDPANHPARQARKMIVGAGLVARAFEPHFANDDRTLIFASGVSNSSEKDFSAFQREKLLLEGHLQQTRQRLVYFSSCNVANPRESSPYFQHKRQMEQLVKESGHGIVLRLPQVVGKTRNPNTLTNFLHDSIIQNRELTIWSNAQRNLIDIDDVASITVQLLQCENIPAVTAIASPWSLAMPAVVDLFEEVLGIKARRILVDKGESMSIDSALSESIAKDIGIDFGTDYPLRVINKYYSPSHES